MSLFKINVNRVGPALMSFLIETANTGPHEHHVFLWILFRSSDLRCSLKKVVLKNFAKFTGKYLCQSVYGWGLQFAKFLRKPFLQMTSKRLLLFFKIFTKQLFFGTPLNCSLREKCPNTGYFWSVFSRSRTEYGDIRSISPYSVRIRENTNQK